MCWWFVFEDLRLRTISLPAAVGIALLALPAAAVAAPTGDVSVGAPPPLTTPAPGTASAALRACRVAVDQASRSATFAAEMTATSGSSRLELRMQLLSRPGPHVRFTAVDGPGLGIWQRALPGRTEFIYVKQVTNLPAPAQYRADVSFRWIDAGGAVVRRAHRRSGICTQRDERAALSVTRLDTTAAAPAIRAPSR